MAMMMVVMMMLSIMMMVVMMMLLMVMMLVLLVDNAGAHSIFFPLLHYKVSMGTLVMMTWKSTSL